MRIKRLLALLLAGAMSVSLLSGCGNSSDTPSDTTEGATEDAAQTEQESTEDTSLQYVLDNGKLIMGLDSSFPPMGFEDETGAIVGFDIDVAAAVCELLGVELVTQPISWDAKELELNSNSIDCIWNGFSKNADREKAMSLSIPYMENHMALVVLPDSGISTIADMEGKSLALQNGSSAEEALNSEEGTTLREAISGTNGFDENLSALLDLEAGGSDAVLMDDVVATYLIDTSGKNMVILSDFLYAEDYVIGFRKTDAALTEAVNDALRQLKADGTLGEISVRWFGEDIIADM